MSYLRRLAARLAAVDSCLCLGLDPDPTELPRGWPGGVGGAERFGRLLLSTAAPLAAAVKVNVAFFEAYGSAGMAALERLRAEVPSDLPFIVDAKRADIGSTARRQAVALYDALGADAVTLNPYLGRDALEPFLARPDRFAYVVCRTSNPGSAQLQQLDVDGQPLYLRVARLVVEWSVGEPNVGLVVGATAPSEMARVRVAVPSLPFLVPGVGAQGGDVAAVLAEGPALAAPAGRMPAGGLLVNVSRGITQAAREAQGDEAAAAALAAAATDWSARLRPRSSGA